MFHYLIKKKENKYKININVFVGKSFSYMENVCDILLKV